MPHEKYEASFPNGLTYDYAIVTLTSKLTFTNKIQAACLPMIDNENEEDKDKVKPYDGKMAYITGWGIQDDGSLPSQNHQTYDAKYSDVLKEAKVKVLENDVCIIKLKVIIPGFTNPLKYIE